jgi:type I restriction enzyme S subunit
MSLPRYPTYKDSGVEWLGEVPAHWDVRKIKWLCQIKKRISGELGHDVLSITQQGIKIKDIESNDGQISMDYSKYQFVNVGDFAMNHMDLLTGYVDISDVFGVTSPDYRVFSIRDQKDCYDRYVLYLFQMGYRNKIFYAFGQGSSQLGRWRLPTEQFNDFFFPLPSIEEQQTIATFLDRETGKIDALIAEQRRLVELLAEKRQAVISHAVTKGLNPNVPVKDSGIEWLGEVPAHWEVVPLKKVISQIESGVSVNASDQPASGAELGVLKTSCVYSGQFDVNENKTVIEAEIGRVACPLKVGTLIVSRMNTPDLVGAAGLVRFAPQNIYLPDRLWQVSFNNAVPVFVYYWTQSVFYRAQIRVACAGASSSMQNLGQDQFRSFNFPNPSLDEQRTIAAFLDSETTKFNVLTLEAIRAIELLQERRSALISAAVTGKIDVRSFFENNHH